jgi:hypothetical protein
VVAVVTRLEPRSAVALTSLECALLAQVAGEIRAAWADLARRNGTPVPPVLDELLETLWSAAMTDFRRASADASAPLPQLGDPAGGQPRWTSTEAAAAVIGISREAVAAAARAGRIVARRRGRAWQVDAADVERFTVERGRRTA